MRVTSAQLKQIVSEETGKVLLEKTGHVDLSALKDYVKKNIPRSKEDEKSLQEAGALGVALFFASVVFAIPAMVDWFGWGVKWIARGAKTTLGKVNALFGQDSDKTDMDLLDLVEKAGEIIQKDVSHTLHGEYVSAIKNLFIKPGAWVYKWKTGQDLDDPKREALARSVLTSIIVALAIASLLFGGSALLKAHGNKIMGSGELLAAFLKFDELAMELAGLEHIGAAVIQITFKGKHYKDVIEKQKADHEKDHHGGEKKRSKELRQKAQTTLGRDSLPDYPDD